VDTFAGAEQRWMHDPSAGLGAELERAYQELRELASALKDER
jgi:hypothetical protein